MRNIPASSGGSDQNTVAAQPGINRFDFRGYPNLSYGYQMPFGMHGKPRYGMDPRQPLAADKGPAFAVGGETGGNHVNGAATGAASDGRTAAITPRHATEAWRGVRRGTRAGNSGAIKPACTVSVPETAAPNGAASISTGSGQKPGSGIASAIAGVILTSGKGEARSGVRPGPSGLWFDS
jgi:hypothetical protein